MPPVNSASTRAERSRSPASSTSAAASRYATVSSWVYSPISHHTPLAASTSVSDPACPPRRASSTIASHSSEKPIR